MRLDAQDGVFLSIPLRTDEIVTGYNMFRFFSSIRQKLVDGGHLGKYITYALGEILLIVIGILIALKINDWNNEIENTEKQNYYLSEIKDSLNDDLNSIATTREFNVNKRVILNNILKLFDKDLSNQQRLTIFTAEADPFSRYSIFIPGMTVFNNMIRSESISIIDNDQLRGMLTDYYEFNYMGGIQERIIIKNRYIIDNYYHLFLVKENADRASSFETELPSTESLTVHTNQKFFADLVGIQMILNGQDQFLNAKQAQIKQIIKYIDETII